MSYMAGKLNRRVQIQTPKQTAADDGSLELTYTTIATVWAEIVNESAYIAAVRGVNSEDASTHVFRVRASAIRALGNAFTSAFSSDMDGVADIYPVKKNYCLFVQRNSATHGRRFSIAAISLDEKLNEYYLIRAREIDERGTGARE